MDRRFLLGSVVSAPLVSIPNSAIAKTIVEQLSPKSLSFIKSFTEACVSLGDHYESSADKLLKPLDEIALCHNAIGKRLYTCAYIACEDWEEDGVIPELIKAGIMTSYGPSYNRGFKFTPEGRLFADSISIDDSMLSSRL